MTPLKWTRITAGLKISACIAMVAIALYAHIEKQNALTALRLKIPLMAKEVKEIEEENRTLQYAIDMFESPEHLLKLRRTPQFSHLAPVTEDKVLILPQQAPL